MGDVGVGVGALQSDQTQVLGRLVQNFAALVLMGEGSTLQLAAVCGQRVEAM